MPVFDAVIVTAIVVAFVIFAIVLAWADYQTRDLPRTTSATAKSGAPKQGH